VEGKMGLRDVNGFSDDQQQYLANAYWWAIMLSDIVADAMDNGIPVPQFIFDARRSAWDEAGYPEKDTTLRQYEALRQYEEWAREHEARWDAEQGSDQGQDQG
jgi:hypothetical protein